MRKTITQAEFEMQIVYMLVEDMQPMAIVERSGFQKFCSVCLPQYALPSRRTVARRLDDVYKVEKKKMVDALEKARWVSATADIWSSHKRAFMGITVHFVDSDTLKMVSSALACRRFKGAHTGEAIGKMIYAIFKEFGIESKIQNVVTDNASNFAKAFALFQAEDEDSTDADEMLLSSEDVAGLLDDFESIGAEETDDVILPPHKRCGDHSLNLVASVDALKARDDKQYQRSYDRAMGKVQALSNAVNRSPKQNDAVVDIIGQTFLQPNCTRWCSEYYAVQRVVDIGLEKVVECQTQLGQSPMTPADMTFLTAFVKLLKPLVIAMKLLEGETDCYIGQLIPTVMGLEKKFEQCSNLLMKPLAQALLSGVKARFETVLNSDDYIIPTMLHPKFKLSFLPEEHKLKYREVLFELYS